MKILFFGSDKFSSKFLEAIIYSKHKVSLVVTHSDKRKGRGLKFTPSPVKEISSTFGIDLVQTEAIDKLFLEKLSYVDFDCIVVVSFGLILSKALLDLTPGRCINVHPSLLPKYRGPSPIESSLLNGEKETGISIIKMNERIDEGEIYVQAKFGIAEEDNKTSLEEKLIKIGSPLLISILDLLEEGELRTIPQDNSLATYTSFIKKEDLRIDWNKKAIDIVNRIRAFSFEPGCFTFWRGKRIKILKTKMCTELCERGLLRGLTAKVEEFKNGSVLASDSKNGVLVKCGDGKVIRLELLKPEGKNMMTDLDFINGYPLKVGEVFE